MGEHPDRRPPSQDANAAWSVLSLLLSGMLAWGFIGWLIDRWLETEAFLPIGIIGGAAGSLYLVMKRFGQE